MMTQSIPTQASGILFQAAGSANIAKRSGKKDFDMFFDSSIKKETKITLKPMTIKGDSKDVPNQEKAQATDGKEKIAGIITDNKAISSDIGYIDTQIVENVTEEEQNPIELINSDLLEQILQMLGQIRNVIMNDLELTPGEFDSMMENLGLKITDLADPQVISKLVLADAQTTDPLAMLLDEQLGDTFQGLLAKVEDIKSEANRNITDDELKQILEQNVQGEDADAFIGVNETETQQPQVEYKRAEKETGEGKDNNKLQTASEDREKEIQGPIVATKGDSELKDTNDSKAKSDRADGLEAFLNKLSANYSKPVVEIGNEGVRLYEIREIAQQIIEQIRVIINPEQTTMELQLNPDHLGKVNLTISSKEGVMTAHFSVQNDLAKEAIESQLITLKETLAEQGIKVETIEVTVASYTFDQNSPSDDAEQKMQKKQRSGHKITFDEAVAMSEEPIDEANNTNLTGTMGYNIDYTA